MLRRYIFATLLLIFFANTGTCQKWTSQLWHNPFNLSWRAIGDRSQRLYYEKKKRIFIPFILRNKLCYAKAMPNRFLLNANTILGLVRHLKCFVERKTPLRLIRSRSIAHGTFNVEPKSLQSFSNPLERACVRGRTPLINIRSEIQKSERELILGY